MAGNRELRITIIGDASKAKAAFGETEAGASKMSTTIGKVAAAAGGIYAGAKAFDFLKSSIHDAADEGQEINVLANTMRKATGASKDQIDATEAWITKMQNATGIMDDQLRPAMGKLLISGRSVSQAEHDMGVAADIAAARHVSLETVVNAMGKAALGNVAGLGRLGLATKDAAGETLSYDAILKQASATMGGSAAAAADTAAGKAAILQAKFADLKENIGTALIPIMESLTAVIGKIVSWFNNQSSATQKVILIIGGLIVVIGPLAGLIAGVTTVVGALSVAMGFLAANPIVLVIAAIAALAVGLVIAYEKCETFRNIVNAVFAAVAGAARFLADVFGAAFDWIKGHIDLIIVAGLGPLGVAIVLLKDNWKTVWEAIQATIETVWKAVKPIFEALISIVKKAIDLLKSAKDLIGGTIGKIGSIVGKIPGFASGTTSAPRGLALVGEDGPELLNLRGGERIFSAPRTRGLLAASGGAGGVTVMPGAVHVEFHGGDSGAQRRVLDDAFADFVRELTRRVA